MPPNRTSGLVLSAPYPNPTAGQTSLRFALDSDSSVRVTVHDVVGRLVRTLRDEEIAAGIHVETWDTRDESGVAVESGVYFVRMTSDRQHTAVEKLLVVR